MYLCIRVCVSVHASVYFCVHVRGPGKGRAPFPPASFSSVFSFQIFERILFIWAIRHPASGYVQGINDLVTPFFVVFLCEHLGKSTLP